MVVPITGVKPLMYGYMRVAGDAPDDELVGIEQRMRRFAEVEGFCYATTFYEYQNGAHAAFNELTSELQRTEAQHVVVPSLSHISAHPILLSHMVEQLALDGNAHVHELDGQLEIDRPGISPTLKCSDG